MHTHKQIYVYILKYQILLVWLMKATVLTESSFIFSLGSLCYSDVYRCESDRCCTLPFFLWSLYVLSFYWVLFISAMSTDASQVGVPFFPSFQPLLSMGFPYLVVKAADARVPVILPPG